MDIGYTWEGFKADVQKGMMFNKVNKYFKDATYEDDVNFYRYRFEAAKKVSNNVLRHFVAKLNDIAIDGALKDGLKYDENRYLLEETKLAYLSKHVRWEFNEKKKEKVGRTASFNPYTGEYKSFK